MYIFEMDEHVGIFLVEDGTDADDDLELVLAAGEGRGLGGTARLHLTIVNKSNLMLAAQ